MLEATTPLELTVRITGFPYDHHICLPLGLLEPSSGNRRGAIAEWESQSGNRRMGIESQCDWISIVLNLM